MPGPARSGALIYAKHLEQLSTFYRELLHMTVLTSDDQHHVIESADAQLIIHAIPRMIAEDITITTPPQPREDQAIKLFFTVDATLAEAEQRVVALGGGVFGAIYDGPGFRARNAMDPEGNIFHLRATG